MFWIIFSIILGSIFCIFLIIIIKNQNIKLDIYEQWIFDFAKTVQLIDQELDIIDSEGTFRSDDEVGFFYQAMYSILKELHGFGLVDLPEKNVPINLNFREEKIQRIIKKTRRDDITTKDIQKRIKKND